MILRRSYRFVPVCFFVFYVSILTAFSQSVGGQAGSPLRFGFGSLSLGMGNATAAVLGDQVTAFENPALVPYQPSRTLMASVGLLSLDRSLNVLCYTQSLKPSAGIAIGFISAGVSEIQGRDRDGDATSVYSTSENAFTLSFGLTATEELSIGVTTKILYSSQYEGVSSTTTGFDLGALYSMDENIQIAFVVQDLNSKYRWETSPLFGRSGNVTVDRFPLRRKIGISSRWLESAVVSAGEVEWIGSSFIVRFGSTVLLTKSFRILGGWDQISPKGEFDSRPSFGFAFDSGWESFNPTLYYTYVLEPYAPAGAHFLAIRVSL